VRWEEVLPSDELGWCLNSFRPTVETEVVSRKAQGWRGTDLRGHITWLIAGFPSSQDCEGVMVILWQKGICNVGSRLIEELCAWEGFVFFRAQGPRFAYWNWT
jgi:hypothetical protein